jgi:hypothetical protein
VLQVQRILPVNFITKFIAKRINPEVNTFDPFIGIIFKDCENCQSCVHIFKTVQETPCWDCIEHNFDAFEKR